jgi:protein gp37
MARSKIEWTDYTFNPWIGCTKVSAGCKNCYAERENKYRKWTDGWGPGAPRKRTSPANWKMPILWDMTRWFICPECGWRGPEGDAALNNFGMPRCPKCDCGNELEETRARVFCASLADVFDEEVPDEWRDDLRRLMHSTPNLDWLILTKRVEKMVDYFEQEPFFFMGSNLWMGVSIENQITADYRIPYLFRVSAEKRFVSYEPALGPVTFDLTIKDGNGAYGYQALTGRHFPFTTEPRYGHHLDWIIMGGESGPGARPMDPDWARSVLDQCQAAGVPFFLKQWGEWTPYYPIHKNLANIKETWIDGRTFYRVGRDAAGRMLDGREWNEFPEMKE